ncbi:MAG: nucleotidyltransferase family protein [Armatimonadota bacterium]
MATRSRRGSSPNVEQLLSTLRAHMPELRAQYHVRNLWAFGSYVRGEAKRRSDFDLLVEFDQVPTFFEFVHLERQIGDLLGLKVDLVMRTALKPGIGAHILKEIVPI